MRLKHFSFSSLDKEDKCPRSFYFSKVLQLPKTATIPLERGSGTHKYAEAHFKGQDVENEVNNFINQTKLLKHSKKAQQEVWQFGANAVNLVKPGSNSTVLIEKEYTGKIDNENIKIIVDLLEVAGNVLIVQDYKTNYKKYEVTDTMQLPLYAHVLLQQPEFQHIKKVIGRLWFVRWKTQKGALKEAELTKEVIDAAVEKARGLIAEINEALKWPGYIGFEAKPGKPCEWCEFTGYCLGIEQQLKMPQNDREALELAGQLFRLKTLLTSGEGYLKEYLEEKEFNALKLNEAYIGLYPKYNWQFKDPVKVIKILQEAGLDPNEIFEVNGWALRRLAKKKETAEIAEIIQQLGKCEISRYFGQRDSAPEC